MVKKSALLILLGLCLSGCVSNTSKSPLPASEAPRVEQDWLSDSHARLRKRQVEDVSYHLALDLRQSERFYGTATIHFTNRLLSNDLTLDFSHGAVEQVWVDDTPVAFSYNDYFITLSKDLLKLGKMAVKIRYSHSYSDNGSGLYRYHDSLDDRSYVYTHFEPYEANKLFPGFDQPNIRASYEVQVTAPKTWQVITSVLESKVEPQGDAKLWTFPASAKISSYVFPLHAGPYHVWHDNYQGIPLRLFVRQSLAKYIDSMAWFDVTKKGLAFFNQYFDYPYPFAKYDQLIVPDFNISGMENVAAVTYTERVVQRGEYTREEQERIAGLLLHEMSHMWFGDLITVDWWSNLWLKESFATYMSKLALGETGLSANAWNDFYTKNKQAAYSADAMVTTHPIQMPVSDTKNGVASFDAITYNKGASVLNQLTHYLGDDVFREGIRRYFKQYAYQATTLPDFMNTLGAVAGQDMTAWTDDWLYKAGTNTLKVAFNCSNGKISQLKVLQTAPKSHPYLRSHRVKLGLFSFKADKMVLLSEQPLMISGAETEVEALVGTDCPDIVYPNYGDWGYVKVLFDEQSQQQITKAIPMVDDAMLRAMFYQSLWDMVENQQLTLTQYIDQVSATLADETDLKVLSLVHQRLSQSRRYLNLFDAHSYPQKARYLAKLEGFNWAGLYQQVSGSDQQKMWFDAALVSSRSNERLDYLVSLLTTASIDGMAIDQDLRWDIIVHLSAMGHPLAAQLLAREKQMDPSHMGVLSAIAADAAKPDMTTKLYWLEQFERTTGRLSARKQKVAMENLFPSNQTHLQTPFANRILEDLVKFDLDRDQKLISTMVDGIMPATCTEQSVKALGQTIRNNPQLGLTAMKGLQQMHQADQLCVAIKANVGS